MTRAVLAISSGQAADIFLGAAITAIVGMVSGGTIALLRFIRRTDRDRVDRMEGTAHRQWHVIRWAKVVGRHVDVPFPLPEDVDDHADWDEGLK